MIIKFKNLDMALKLFSIIENIENIEEKEKEKIINLKSQMSGSDIVQISELLISHIEKNNWKIPEIKDWLFILKTSVKTYEEWDKDLSEYLDIGDLVDKEMVNYFVETLPPACNRSDLIQIGEPYSHKEDPEDGKWKGTYATLCKTPEGWRYAGHCFRGKKINQTIF